MTNLEKGKRLHNKDWESLTQKEKDLVLDYVYNERNKNNTEEEWDKLESNDWTYLLIRCPQFAEHCRWNKITSTVNLCIVFDFHPTLMYKCEWNKLNKRIINNQDYLFEQHPKLKTLFKLNNL